ncbi:MAG: hypothetical protein KDK78_11000 [Chlamydiia bacterium]|nr:hypothetical protein [Chlamydiia bacterium]
MSGTSTEYSRQAELGKMDGELWRCTGCKDGKYGGKVYSFEGKEGLVWKEPSEGASIEEQREALECRKNLSKIFVRIFPATEPNPNLPFDLGTSPHMAELGFCCEPAEKGYRIWLPDEQAFTSAWEKVAESIREPARKALRVHFSEGDLFDDATYARLLTENDAAVSIGREMVHDMTNHLVPVLRCLFEVPIMYLTEYQRKTSAGKKADLAMLDLLVDRVGRGSIHAEQATLHLAACRDLISTINPEQIKWARYRWEGRAFTHGAWHAQWLQNPAWLSVWCRKYPERGSLHFWLEGEGGDVMLDLLQKQE